MRFFRTAAWIMAALLMIVFHTGCGEQESGNLPANVAVRVNGEPIYKKDLNRGIPSSYFDASADSMRANKLSRMIDQTAIRQFLVKHKVHVKKSLVDAAIARLEETPPSTGGCACCTYKSLDDYLAASGLTREELRTNTKNDIGLRLYAAQSWRKAHPTKSDVLKAIGDQSLLIRRQYVKSWQIFFNTFQQAGNVEQIIETKRALADKAWKRLQGGEDFAVVARSMSEDMTSKRKGGKLGLVDRSAYGEEFRQMLSEIEPGQYSKPFQSSWGFHIIKWEPMSDDDVADYAVKYFADQEYQKLYTEIMQSEVVERPESEN